MRRRYNNKLQQIINESVKYALNEISWQLSDKATELSHERSEWTHHVYKALDTVEEYLSQFYEDEDYTQAAKLAQCVEKIRQFVDRKDKQSANLEKLDSNNFKKQHNGVDKYNFGDKVENTDEDDWTPSQREYADYKL